jgi:hypothetical protein
MANRRRSKSQRSLGTEDVRSVGAHRHLCGPYRKVTLGQRDLLLTVDAERPPRERLLKDPFTEIASKEEPIDTTRAQRGQEAQFGDRDLNQLKLPVIPFGRCVGIESLS